MTNIDTMNSRMAELVETVAMQSAEMIAARLRTGVDRQIKQYRDINTFEDLKALLDGLAFDIKSDDPWKVLGIPKFEGPTPSKDLVENRVRDGVLLASISKSTWAEEDIRRASEIPDAFKVAKDVVLQEMPRVLKELKRTKVDGKAVPMHLEASPELMWECLTKGGHVATQLSNLQGMQLNHMVVPENSKLVPIGDSRGLYREFSKGVHEAMAALRPYQGDAITLWAPSENRHLQFLLGGIWEAAVTQAFEITVKILIPHTPYPGCHSPELLLDLWSHPALSSKWNKILMEARFLRQPTRCVFSGTYGPMHHLKSLVVATFSTSGASMAQAIYDWMPTLMTYEDSPAIWIDCTAAEEMRTLQAITQLHLPGMTRIDGPKKSLGSTGIAPRVTFSLAFDKDAVSDLEIRIYIDTLRDTTALEDRLIGSKALFGNSGAILMDITDPSVASTYYSSMDEMVFASPSLVILQTSMSAEDWGNTITISSMNTPLTAIQKMRYRSSNRGGRPFAKAQVLEQDVNSKKAQAHAANTSTQEHLRRSLMATISIQELSAKGRDDMARSLIDAIQNATTIQYDEQVALGDLKEGEWRMIKSTAGHWTGRIQVQAKAVADIQNMMAKIHGSAIEVDGLSHTVEISSDFVKSPALKGR